MKKDETLGIVVGAAAMVGAFLWARKHTQGTSGIGAAKKRSYVDIYRYILYPLFLNDEFIEWNYWKYKYDEYVAMLIKTQEELDATFIMIDNSNLSPYKKNWLKNVIKTDYQYPGERMSWRLNLQNAEVFDELD